MFGAGEDADRKKGERTVRVTAAPLRRERPPGSGGSDMVGSSALGWFQLPGSERVPVWPVLPQTSGRRGCHLELQSDLHIDQQGRAG